MYLYYLLGWKLHRRFYQDYENGIAKMTVEEHLKVGDKGAIIIKK